MTAQVINTPVPPTTGRYLSPPNGGEIPAPARADRGRAPARNAGAGDYQNRAGVSTVAVRYCHLCPLVLDPVLVAAGFTTHPCCDPGERVAGQGAGDVQSIAGVRMRVRHRPRGRVR